MKDSHTNSLIPSPRTQAAAWKVPLSHGKEIQGLRLGRVPERQASGITSRDRSADRGYFLEPSFYLAGPVPLCGISAAPSTALTLCPAPLGSVPPKEIHPSLVGHLSARCPCKPAPIRGTPHNRTLTRVMIKPHSRLSQRPVSYPGRAINSPGQATQPASQGISPAPIVSAAVETQP